MVKFQTWHFIVRYGAPAFERGDMKRLRDVIGFAVGLELASGLIGLAGGLLLLPYAAQWFDIGAHDLNLAMLYCTLIPTMTAATPTGILRVFDRFDQIALQQMAPLCAVGALASYFGGFGFTGFVLTWYAADLTGDLCLWALSIQELRRHKVKDALRPALLGLAWCLGRVDHQCRPFNLGRLGAGQQPDRQRLAKPRRRPVQDRRTFFDSARKPARTDIAQLLPRDHAPRSRHPWQLAMRSAFISGAIAVVVLLIVTVGGEPVIDLVFGKKYVEAYDLLQLMTASLVVAMAAFPLESLLHMAGRERSALAAEGTAALGYAVVLVVLIHLFGIWGAGLAYVVGVCLKTLFMLVPTVSAYRLRHTLTHGLEAGAPA